MKGGREGGTEVMWSMGFGCRRRSYRFPGAGVGWWGGRFWGVDLLVGGLCCGRVDGFVCGCKLYCGWSFLDVVNRVGKRKLPASHPGL